jgi:hypothetical protein
VPYTRLKRAGRCASCGGQTPAGAQAWWDPESRNVTCSACRPPVSSTSSVRSFADGRQSSYESKVRSTWGPLAGLALMLKPTNQDAHVARKGAAGEERLTAELDKFAARSASPVAVLHDRGIPGRRENMDHIVVTSAGVWAVDSKAYSGRIVVPWLSRDRLVIGGRDQDKLLVQSRRQQSFLVAALDHLGLPALPVRGALTFLDGDFAFMANGADVGNVLVSSPRRLRRELAEKGTLTAEQVQYVAHRLAAWFHPAR